MHDPWRALHGTEGILLKILFRCKFSTKIPLNKNKQEEANKKQKKPYNLSCYPYFLYYILVCLSAHNCISYYQEISYQMFSIQEGFI